MTCAAHEAALRYPYQRTDGGIFMQRNTFIATVEGETIYAINGVTQERSEIGMTQKGVKALQDALTGIIQERDELHAKCVAAGLIVPQKTPEEMAQDALSEVRELRSEMVKMAESLTAIQEALTNPTQKEVA